MKIEKYFEEFLEMRNKIGSIPKGYNFSCQEDYIYNKGRRYFERPLSRAEKALVRDVKSRTELYEGHCFENCLYMALNDDTGQLRYVEGYADAVIVVHHAWLVLNDAVVDVTWDLTRTMKVLTPERQYYGVEFSDKKLLRQRLRDRKQLTFLDDWPNRYPLLRQERNPHEQAPQRASGTKR